MEYCSSSVPVPVPVGFRFDPTDDELLMFLERKVKGLPLPSQSITEKNVYACQPWLLDGDDDKNGGFRYYLVKREQMSKNGNGKRPRRVLEGGDGGCGWWRATTGESNIYGSDGSVVGQKKSLKFYSLENKDKNRKQGIKTEWLMHEYSLQPTTFFQEWVICRIKNKAILKM